MMWSAIAKNCARASLPMMAFFLPGFLSGMDDASAQALYGEAPVLADRVASGTLMPVEERLPGNPKLVQPIEQVGVYGGAWKMALRKSRDHALLIRSIGYENLMRWKPDWNGVDFNVAQSIVASEDSRVFTVKLRRGMRWSDGHPFTADDVLFWFEDVFQNPELRDVSIPWRANAAIPFRVEKEDDWTFRFVFEKPHGLFLQALASPEGVEPTAYPAHYLKQYHPRYNPRAGIEAMAEGYGSWVERFTDVFGKPGTVDDRSRWINPDLPTLNAWVLTGVYGEDATLVARRNPYYWKIDPAGNQLPYLDEVVFTLVEDKPAAADAAKQGLVNAQSRHVSRYVPKILEQEPGLEAFNIVDADMNAALIILNLNHRDPVLNRLFNTKNFRIALSYGIDRQDISNRRFGGQARPYQGAPRPDSEHFHKQLATQYLDYDPALANRLLDDLGLVDRTQAGIRLLADGRPLSFVLETVGSPRLAILKIIREHWQQIGVDVTVVDQDRDKFFADREQGIHDATVWGGDGGLAVLLFPIHYVPYHRESFLASGWSRWFENPQSAEAIEPIPSVKRQFELYTALKSEADPRKQATLMREILDIAADQFHNIGTLLPVMRKGVKAKNMRNVPLIMPGSWTYPTPAPTNPFQYFIATP